MKTIRKILAATLFVICAAGFAFAQNYKIKQVMTMSGQKIESTVYVKNSRQRTESGGFMGMGGDVADVQQCDLKRNIKINDTKKLYYIEPFASDLNDAATTDKSSTTNQKSPKTVKGGTVTITYNITDTGERKQMFGLTARHLKTTMTMQASADACTDADMKMETDGWYVDLPQFSCPVQAPKNPMMGMGGGGGGGCQDKMIVKQTGSGKLGFPLTETRTMKMGDDEDMPTMTQTVETVEFSKATLEDKLFDIPAGYTQAKSSQELYDRKSMSQAMMQNSSRNDSDDGDTPKTTSVKSNSSMSNSSMNSQMSVNKKKAGTIRIGVYVPTNKNGDAISTTNMQMYLVGKLTGKNVEAVGVSSEADARAANCDYVLSSDFSKLKVSTASKVGGFLGKVTNADTSGAKTYEAQVDFKLISFADGKTVLQNKASNKSESDVDRAAENVLAQEAQSILGTIMK
ncbi:MAG: hypothetical protein ABWZ66_08945 [Pyrinomonadaceae bacterium]